MTKKIISDSLKTHDFSRVMKHNESGIPSSSKPTTLVVGYKEDVISTDGQNIIVWSGRRGMQMPFSDIDICAITDEKITEREKLKIISCSSERITWHDLPVTMRYRILKEGRLLFARDSVMPAAAVETMGAKPHAKLGYIGYFKYLVT